MEEQVRKIQINQRLYDRYSDCDDPGALELIPNPFIHIIADDCIAEGQVHNSEVLNEIAYYGRHFKANIWLNTQHGHALHPGFRQNADVAITFEQVCLLHLVGPTNPPLLFCIRVVAILVHNYANR